MAEPNIAGGGGARQALGGFAAGMAGGGGRGHSSVFSGGLQFDTSGVKDFRKEMEATATVVEKFWAPFKDLDRNLGASVNKFFDNLDKRLEQTTKRMEGLGSAAGGGTYRPAAGGGSGFHSTVSGWSQQYQTTSTGATTAAGGAVTPASSGGQQGAAADLLQASTTGAAVRAGGPRMAGMAAGMAAYAVGEWSDQYINRHREEMYNTSFMLNRLRQGGVGGAAGITQGLYGMSGYTSPTDMYSGAMALRGMTPGTPGFFNAAQQAGGIGMVSGTDFTSGAQAMAQFRSPGFQFYSRAAGLGVTTPGGPQGIRNVQDWSRQFAQRSNLAGANRRTINEVFDQGGAAQLGLERMGVGMGTPLYDTVQQTLLADQRLGRESNFATRGGRLEAGVTTAAQENRADFDRAVARFTNEMNQNILPILTKWVRLGTRVIEAFEPVAPVVGKVVGVMGTLGEAIAAILGVAAGKGVASKIGGMFGRGGGGGGRLARLTRGAGRGGVAALAGAAADEFVPGAQGSVFGEAATTALQWGGTGAMIGSVVPGVGTAVGGAFGGVLGALYGGVRTAQGNAQGDNRDRMGDHLDLGAGIAGRHKDLQAERGARTTGVLNRILGQLGGFHVTSAVRDRDDNSYHNTGHALDIVPAGKGVDQMSGFAKKIAQKFGKGLKELIYGGTDGKVQIYNGKPHQYSQSTLDDHHDHIHVSATEESLKNVGGIDIGGGGGGGSSNDTGASSAATASITSSVGFSILQSLMSGGGGGAPGSGSSTGSASKGGKGKSGGGGATGSGGNPSANQTLGKQMAANRGWTGDEWGALKELWNKESGWKTTADNPTSSAYGIPQALIAMHDMPAGYYDKKTGEGANTQGHGGDPKVQIRWGLNYIANRYGSPSAALSFHKKNNWYGDGGYFSGPKVIGVGEKGDEAVLPLTDQRAMDRIGDAISDGFKRASSRKRGRPGETTMNVSLNVQVLRATDAEAERLAKMTVEKIREAQDEDTLVST